MSWENMSGEGLLFFLYLFTQISERLVEFGKTFLFLYVTRADNEQALKNWNHPRHEKIRTLWSFLANWVVGCLIVGITSFYIIVDKIGFKDWNISIKVILMGFIIATVSQPLHNALGKFASEKPKKDTKND